MSTQNLHTQHPHPAEGSHLHRIGSASRLAGVPVSTLRMWESRHGAFAPGKSDGRHRLYTELDVVRARVLRQLVKTGHSIGRIAKLDLPQLQQMLTAARAASPQGARAEPPASLAVVVVGAALAARLASSHWRSSIGGALLELRAVFMSLDDAALDEAAASMRDADVLVARVNAVQPAIVDRLVALKAAAGIRSGVLLYNFGARPALDALREAGFLLRREPIGDGELAELLRSLTWAPTHKDTASPARPAAIPAPRYSDEELAVVASSPSHMLCECPRHIADIIAQLTSFEEYSTQCLNDSEEDAHVHAQLRSVAGSARALFDGALDLVLANERRKAAAMSLRAYEPGAPAVLD